MKIKHFIGSAGLFCYIAGMSTAFLLVSYFQTGEAMELFFLPWLLWVLGTYLLDLQLLKRGISLSVYLIWNTVSFVILALLGNLFWMRAKGLTARCFAVVFYGATLVIAEERARTGVRPNQTLVQTEGMIMLLGLLLLLEEMGIAPASMARFYVLAAVICSLLALILTRVMTENQVKVGGSRFQGGFLLGTLFSLMILLGLGFAAAFSQGGRRLLQALVEWVRRGITFLLLKLEHFLNFLISLFPADEMEEMDLTAEPMPGEMEEVKIVLEGDFDKVLLTAGILLAIVGVLAFLVLLRRLRHIRMRRLLGQGVEIQDGVVRENRIWQQFRSWLAKQKQALVFRWQCLRYGNTPPGLLLEAERWGRQHQMARMTGESPQAYLRRMASGPEPLEEKKVHALKDAAALLEQFFYSDREPKWTSDQVKAWKRAIRE